MDYQKYSNIVGYGIGQYYENTKAELSKLIKLDYLCDRKWEETQQKEYDGIPIIRKKELKKLKTPLVIVFTASSWIYESIKKDMEILGVEFIRVDELVGINGTLNGKMLKERYPDGRYEDTHGNIIYFDSSLSDKFLVSFRGNDNILKLGKNISIGSLHVIFGKKGYCSIGDNSEIIGTEIYVSDASVQIGKDCLFSAQIILRTHDGHHIFDMETHQRLNLSKDIEVGNHVWIAYRATLLGGTKIGTGSVVGTNAVTSSQFGEHKVIAGVPAKIIKENVCWSKDDTTYFNWNCLDECIYQEALKYL